MKELDKIIVQSDWDAIVVEGYDGVGKGRLLNYLSEKLGIYPYRPDYNFWQSYGLSQKDRWKISGYFWDIFSHFNNTSGSCSMLFDRGIISGAVYNHDESIALNYKSLLRDMKVLHILVTCDEEDYYKFSGIRDSQTPANYQLYETYTNAYKKMLDIAGVDYIIYENHYDESLAKSLSETCEGCGHYNYGICRHPSINKEVDKNSLRCRHSIDKEVQDAPEMQCV